MNVIKNGKPAILFQKLPDQLMPKRVMSKFPPFMETEEAHWKQLVDQLKKSNSWRIRGRKTVLGLLDRDMDA